MTGTPPACGHPTPPTRGPRSRAASGTAVRAPVVVMAVALHVLPRGTRMRHPWLRRVHVGMWGINSVAAAREGGGAGHLGRGGKVRAPPAATALCPSPAPQLPCHSELSMRVFVSVHACARLARSRGAHRRVC